MGVSGSGKTSVASRLAQRLRWEFAEADTFHSPQNVEKMRSGIPLTDEDRWPWLEAIARRIEVARNTGSPIVVACSALRRSYRERLAAGHDDVRFVYLRGSFKTISGRIAGRTGHYMPPTLLKSQFDTLEEPLPAENALVLSVEVDPPEKLVERLAATFS